MIIFFDLTTIKSSLFFVHTPIPPRATHFHAQTYKFSSLFCIDLMPSIGRENLRMDSHGNINNSVVLLLVQLSSAIYDNLLMLLDCNYVCLKTVLLSTPCCLPFNHNVIPFFCRVGSLLKTETWLSTTRNALILLISLFFNFWASVVAPILAFLKFL